jgi:hypothetical protein
MKFTLGCLLSALDASAIAGAINIGNSNIANTCGVLAFFLTIGIVAGLAISIVEEWK